MQKFAPVRHHIIAGVIATVAVLGLAACSTATPEPEETGSSSVDSAALLTEAYEGVTAAPPTEPVAVTKGLSLWFVSCGESITTCSNPAKGATEAAAAIGWESSICDGKLNPEGWGTCIRQGIAAGADVIMTGGLDCAAISGPLQEAKDAGITTIGIAGNDCDASGGEKLFSGVTQNLDGGSYKDWWVTLGALQAKYLVGSNNGAAKVLNIEFKDAIFGPFITEGFTAELAKYPESEIVASLQLSNADVASGALAQKFSTALLQNPTVNAVAVPIDGWFLAGLAQAIEASGRSADIYTVGGLGSIPNYGLIADGTGEDATVAFSGQWDGWGGVDAALRVLKDQPIVATGIGLQVVDAKHGLPAAGEDFAYSPAVDFRAAYLTTWGMD